MNDFSLPESEELDKIIELYTPSQAELEEIFKDLDLMLAKIKI